MTQPLSLRVRHLGGREYEAVWREMQDFTAARTAQTDDECWFLEHPAVYTLGLNGRRAHIHDPGDIPVIQSDRGGQVTYHGPGQLVMYVLLDLERLGVGVQRLVRRLEAVVIDWLAGQGVTAGVIAGAPGVYVAGAKIASLGLRIKRGCSYHGLSLNVSMDLEPFGRIDPCGYAGLPVTQLKDVGIDLPMPAVAEGLKAHFARLMGYTTLYPENSGSK
jgi:lipoyl(octanoyl) transferase